MVNATSLNPMSTIAVLEAMEQLLCPIKDAQDYATKVAVEAFLSAALGETGAKSHPLLARLASLIRESIKVYDESSTQD